MVSITLAQSKSLRIALPAIDGVGLLTGVLYLLFFAFGFASFTDPDYWWHLRTGQLTVDNLSIPRHDVYSFTAAGQGLLNHQWLPEVLIYLSVSWFGYAVTLGFFIAVALASFGLMQRLLLRVGTPPAVALGLVGLGILMSAPYWTVRPQLLSWFLLAVFINGLIGRSRPAWALVAVMALWANLHLGYMAGLGVAGLWFLSRVWDRLAGERDSDLRGAALFVAACLGATLLNPHGPATLLRLLTYLPGIGGSATPQGITELQSPDFHQPMHVPLLAGIVLLIGLAVVGRVRDRFAIILAVTFTVLALQASRFQPMFAIAYLPAAGLAARHLISLARGSATPPRSVVNLILLIATAVAVLVAIPLLPNAQVHRQPVTDGRVYYPTESLAWLQKNRPDAKVFAPHRWGGYLIYGLYPEGHVYIDGRTDVYGAEIFGDYEDIIEAKAGWQELLERSGANTAVLGPSTRVASELRVSEGWSLVLENHRELVFVRR